MEKRDVLVILPTTFIAMNYTKEVLKEINHARGLKITMPTKLELKLFQRR